jgi:hypothetical protein
MLGVQELTTAQVEHEIDLERKRHLAQMDVAARAFAQDQAEILGLLDIKDRKDRDALARKREEMAAQAEHLQRLSELGPEALLLAADSDKAQLIAELRRTELLKGFSEEQILAMSAEKSPEIARAFQEKFRSLSPEAMTQLYDRMLADRDKAANERATDYHEFAKMMSETFARGMEAMSQAGRPLGGTVVVPGAGGIVCTNCHAGVQTGTRFCTHCGHPVA